MKLSPAPKSIISGFLLACILTSVVSGVFFSIDSPSQNNITSIDILYPLFDWDFESPLKLANQMNERSIYLFGMWTIVGRITGVLDNGYSAELLPYFNYSIGGFDMWYIIKSENWKFNCDTVGMPVELYGSLFSSNSTIFTPLHEGLLLDMLQFENISNRPGGWETIRSIADINATYFDIMHIYQDGSLIWLKSFNDKIVIQYERVSEYINEEREDGIHIGWGLDPEFEPLWFVGDFSNQFANYTIAINQFLDAIYESTR